jgi:hypothetical protein
MGCHITSKLILVPKIQHVFYFLVPSMLNNTNLLVFPSNYLQKLKPVSGLSAFAHTK